jgi:hypothetical protein
MLKMTDVRDATVSFEAVKTSMSQSKAGTILRLAIHPNEVPPSLHTDWVGSRYMVALVKLDDHDQPEIPQHKRETDAMVASAGMLCRNKDFVDYLVIIGVLNHEIYIEATMEGGEEEVAADSLRKHLGIDSRAELHNNSNARERFKQLQEGFESWKMGKPIAG